mgnify:FL=1
MLGVNLYKAKGKELKINIPVPQVYGWNTNSLTKSKMFLDFSKVISDGLIFLNDIDLLREAKSYSRNDLIDREEDPRLSTRHFDLLVAACIAWQMKDYTTVKEKSNYFISDEKKINPAL